MTYALPPDFAVRPFGSGVRVKSRLTAYFASLSAGRDRVVPVCARPFEFIDAKRLIVAVPHRANIRKRHDGGAVPQLRLCIASNDQRRSPDRKGR